MIAGQPVDESKQTPCVPMHDDLVNSRLPACGWRHGYFFLAGKILDENRIKPGMQMIWAMH
jgi:hypothetical protein